MLRSLRTITAEVMAIAERGGRIGRLARLSESDVAGANEGVEKFGQIWQRLERGAVVFAVANDEGMAEQKLAKIVYRQAISMLAQPVRLGTARENGGVLFASLRKPSTEIARHLIGEMVRRWRHEGGTCVDPEEVVIRAACCDEALPIHVDDSPGMSAWELYESALACKRHCGLSLLVIDGLEFLEAALSHHGEERLSRTTRAIRGIARELDTPVLLTMKVSAARSDTAGQRTQELLLEAGYRPSFDQLLVLG
jgi:hypothetical protein